MLLFILSAVIGLALLIMCAWHIWSAAKGETSVEGHDFEAYRGVAKARGDVWHSRDYSHSLFLTAFLGLCKCIRPWVSPFIFFLLQVQFNHHLDIEKTLLFSSTLDLDDSELYALISWMMVIHQMY